jgi:ribosomal protein L44E
VTVREPQPLGDGVMLLRCEECGKEARTAEEARGWRTFMTVVVEGQPAERVDYCPDCAKREFEGDG